MSYNEQEQNSHTFVNENFKSNELNSFYNEFSNNSNEIIFTKEQIDTLEISNQLSSNKKKAESKTGFGGEGFRKYLSCIAASITMGAVIVAPIITTVPAEQPTSLVVEVESEYISYNSYECFFDIKDTKYNLIDATITNKVGDSQTLSVKKENENYRLYFDELMPETEYNLCIIDKEEGYELYFDKFVTDSFITIEYLNNNQKKFSFHKDFPKDADLNPQLLSLDGRDFSSNIILNKQNETSDGYIQLDSLYLDEYIFQLELYPLRTGDTTNENPANDMIVYEKQIALGNLEKLNLSAVFEQNVRPTDAADQIYITYLSGDFNPYIVTEILITHKTIEKFYYFLEFEFGNNNDISFFIQEQIETGEYNISIYGSYESENLSLFNEIWKGTLTVF